METQSLLCSSLSQGHPMTAALAKLPVANAAAEWGYARGDLCQAGAHLWAPGSGWGLGPGLSLSVPRWQAAGWDLSPWEVPGPDFKALWGVQWL